MRTDFVGSLARGINVTFGSTAFETLVSSPKILHSTLEKYLKNYFFNSFLEEDNEVRINKKFSVLDSAILE